MHAPPPSLLSCTATLENNDSVCCNVAIQVSLPSKQPNRQALQLHTVSLLLPQRTTNDVYAAYSRPAHEHV